MAVPLLLLSNLLNLGAQHSGFRLGRLYYLETCRYRQRFYRILNRTALAMTLVGLFAVFSLSALALPAHANTPVSITYYLGGAGGICNLGGLPLSTSILPINEMTDYPGANPGGCTTAWTTSYTGPTFTITSITVDIRYDVVGYCAPNCFGSNTGIVSASAGLQDQNLHTFTSLPGGSFSTISQSCSSPDDLILNPVPNPGSELVNGEVFYLGMGAGGAGFVTFCTSSTLTISGFAVSSSIVPEFPYGSVALLAVALPLVLMLRAKQTAGIA